MHHNLLIMELTEKITNEEMNLLVEEIIGRNWHVSSLVEVFTQRDQYPCYQDLDMHVDEITNGQLTDHFHEPFTLYYLLNGTVETQLVTVLNEIKDRIEFKKNSKNCNLQEVA